MKKCPKSFWSHVKDETKSKSGIGDHKDKDGESKTEDKDKAEILNDFLLQSLQWRETLNYLTLSKK